VAGPQFGVAILGQEDASWVRGSGAPHRSVRVRRSQRVQRPLVSARARPVALDGAPPAAL